MAVLDADLIEPTKLDASRRSAARFGVLVLEADGRVHELPNARVLRKPFTTAELLSLLREAFGPLSSEPMLLVDVLRLANTEGRSVALRCRAW